MNERWFKVTDEAGIHARPATMMIHVANKFDSAIQLSFHDRSVNLKSIMGVMSLGISKGCEVKISADGEDEDAAIDGLQEILEKEGIAVCTTASV